MTALDYGIKVVKAGKSISSTDLRDIIMSSKYSMLKQHSTSTGSATISQGGESCYVDFTHNLGYIPAFLAYVSVSGFESGKDRMIPGYSWGSIAGSEEYNFFGISTAFASSTKIRCTYELATPYNQVIYNADGVYWEFQTGGDNPVGVVVGQPASEGGKSTGWHFPSIQIPKSASISNARIEIQNVFCGPTDGDIHYKTVGIDEDNVGDINDLGKSETSAYHDRNQAKTGGFFNFGFDVKEEVEEIINRNGWSSGNNMGFYIKDRSNDSDSYIAAALNSVAGLLTIIRTGSITITFRVIIFKDKIL